MCSVSLSVMVARCWRLFGHSGRIYSWCATASLATGASNRFWRHLETLASRRSVANEAGLARGNLLTLCTVVQVQAPRRSFAHLTESPCCASLVIRMFQKRLHPISRFPSSTIFTSPFEGFLVAEPAQVARHSGHRCQDLWIHCDWKMTWLHGLVNDSPSFHVVRREHLGKCCPCLGVSGPGLSRCFRAIRFLFNGSGFLDETISSRRILLQALATLQRATCTILSSHVTQQFNQRRSASSSCLTKQLGFSGLWRQEHIPPAFRNETRNCLRRLLLQCRLGRMGRTIINRSDHLDFMRLKFVEEGNTVGVIQGAGSIGNVFDFTSGRPTRDVFLEFEAACLANALLRSFGATLASFGTARDADCQISMSSIPTITRVPQTCARGGGGATKMTTS